MLRHNIIEALFDELEKIAAKVPFIHGTHASFKILKPGIGEKILRSDPNPRAVYTAMRGRRQLERIRDFANAAVARRKGRPTVATGKMDTKKGWQPTLLTSWGKQNIGGVDDALDLVDELDTATGKRRGEIWKALNKGTGRWSNEDPSATLKIVKNRVY